MTWKLLIFGEWSPAYSLEQIKDLISTRPHPYLLAEGTTNEELTDLLTLPRMDGLALLSPHITVAATPTLRALPSLRELVLCGPPITDEFLINLASLATLREITLVHTSCTNQGVQSFLDSTPECRVYKAGADSIYPASLRKELQLFISGTILRQAANRRCVNLGGVWTDESIPAGSPVVKIKAESKAYFTMLKRHPQMSEVFGLGHRVVWLTPSRTVLIIDDKAGEEQMSDIDIDRLFE